MLSPLTDTPDALDLATAASLQARREKLLRGVRNQRIRMGIALALSGCIALFALAAYVIDDYAAARFCAMSACIVFAFTIITGSASRKRALDALRESDRPM
jgi:hypothetical protein